MSIIYKKIDAYAYIYIFIRVFFTMGSQQSKDIPSCESEKLFYDFYDLLTENLIDIECTNKATLCSRIKSIIKKITSWLNKEYKRPFCAVVHVLLKKLYEEELTSIRTKLTSIAKADVIEHVLTLKIETTCVKCTSDVKKKVSEVSADLFESGKKFICIVNECNDILRKIIENKDRIHEILIGIFTLQVDSKDSTKIDFSELYEHFAIIFNSLLKPTELICETFSHGPKQSLREEFKKRIYGLVKKENSLVTKEKS